jgi:hypothetical protein
VVVRYRVTLVGNDPSDEPPLADKLFRAISLVSTGLTTPPELNDVPRTISDDQV